MNLPVLIHDLISANHILHFHNVCDAYGHISIRHPHRADLFIMSGDRSPALVSSPADFVTYYVANASSVDPDAPRGYIERYIHSEIYKRYSNVSCVIHAHAQDVLPYAVSGVPMRPVFHLPGFLGTEVPVWDIESAYNSTDEHDMLVRSQHLGASLAAEFASPENKSVDTTEPDRNFVLMRKHGFTTWGGSIRMTVFRAVFATTNAKVQTDSGLLRQAYGGNVRDGWNMGKEQPSGNQIVMNNPIEPLTAEQTAAAEHSNDGTIDRPWALWVREVEASNLYRNEG